MGIFKHRSLADKFLYRYLLSKLFKLIVRELIFWTEFLYIFPILLFLCHYFEKYCGLIVTFATFSAAELCDGQPLHAELFC